MFIKLTYHDGRSVAVPVAPILYICGRTAPERKALVPECPSAICYAGKDEVFVRETVDEILAKIREAECKRDCPWAPYLEHLTRNAKGPPGVESHGEEPT